MANRTTFLRLEKPNLMSTNWGASLNNNFDRLDKNAESVNNNLRQIRNTMGENNIIGTDENYPYISISVKEGIYTLTLQETTTGGKTNVVYRFLNGKEEINNLGDIGDYTGFYIAKDYDVPNQVPEDVHQIFKQKWSIGEIATKYTGWDSNNLISEPLFVKYKQALGGWYVPTNVGGDSSKLTNKITWEKQFAENAPKTAETSIPIRALNTHTFVWSLKGKEERSRLSSDPDLKGQNNSPYDSDFQKFVDTYIKDDAGLRNTHFDFYQTGRDNNGNMVYVDYTVNGRENGPRYDVDIILWPKVTITESNLYMRIYVGVPDPNNSSN